MCMNFKNSILRERDNMLYDSIFLKCPEKANYGDRKHTCGYLGLEGNGK